MSWKSEAKMVMQKKYGGYCTMCRQLNINPISFHSFTLNEYDRVKTMLKDKYTAHVVKR